MKPKPDARHEVTRTAQDEQTNLGADDLLGQALARQNMARAWQRVKANKGSAGVDGRTVQATGEYLKTAWADIRAALLAREDLGSTGTGGPARCALPA